MGREWPFVNPQICHLGLNYEQQPATPPLGLRLHPDVLEVCIRLITGNISHIYILSISGYFRGERQPGIGQLTNNANGTEYIFGCRCLNDIHNFTCFVEELRKTVATERTSGCNVSACVYCL